MGKEIFTFGDIEIEKFFFFLKRNFTPIKVLFFRRCGF